MLDLFWIEKGINRGIELKDETTLVAFYGP